MGIKIGRMRCCVTLDAPEGAIRARGSCSIDDQKVKTQDVVDAYYDLYPTVYQSGCFLAATRGLDDRLPWLVRDVMQDDVKRAFVTDGLAGAFPNLFEEIVITSKNEVRIREQGRDELSDLYTLPSGFLQLLGVLCAVACTPKNGIVVFDDPTLSLHPYAVKTLVDRVNRWAWEYNLTVLMMTHSTVMLNEFAGTPDRVFMMKRRQLAPVALTEAYDQGWLQGFGLGDLYENDNIGSNMDDLSEPRDLGLPMPAPLTDWYKAAWFARENNSTVSLGDLAIGDLYATASIASNDDDRGC
jgi:energy-coupling factor transporter ATP-binding protein EcfA2